MSSQPSQAQTVPRSHLLAIPLEILLNISSFLPTPDYGNLRLVCRDLEASLFEYFGSEFFTKRAFLLTEFSLEALVDISKSRFAPCLKYLIINLEYPIGVTYQTGSMSIVGRKECYSHQTLVDSGQDVEFIAEALRNLPNLETVGLRDFSSGGRYRDGGDETWRPYGTETFQQLTGSLLWKPSSDHIHGLQLTPDMKHISHAFLAVLRALKYAKADCRARLEVILRSCYLPEIAFNIPRYLEPTLLPILADLKVLFLDVGYSTFPIQMVRKGATNEDYPGLLLTIFLSKLRSLEHLRLNFRDCSVGMSTPVLEWLARYSPTPPGEPQTSMQPAAGVTSDLQARIPQLPRAPALPLLKQLDIGWLTTEPSTLLGLFRRYRSSLRKIALHKVTLQLTVPSDRFVKINLWARFLSHTTKIGLNISCMELSNLRQLYRGSPVPVEFGDPVRLRVPLNIYVRGWRGSDWERGSRELIDSVIVHLPRDFYWENKDDEWIDSYFSVPQDDEMDVD
ncbi:hypothetical protein F4818DRAFT_271421 [Hypoxylon cercidicola]|nr:hypothetical protein F4818DRAFT_271421 [Hypoxylon cercidicola]